MEKYFICTDEPNPNDPKKKFFHRIGELLRFETGTGVSFTKLSYIQTLLLSCRFSKMNQRAARLHPKTMHRLQTIRIYHFRNKEHYAKNRQTENS